MKYGEYLNSQKVPEWQHYYLDYDQLKGMIKELEVIHLSMPSENNKGNLSPIYFYLILF
jgi:SPX domain protein involved in polyphosphate accumulation